MSKAGRRQADAQIPVKISTRDYLDLDDLDDLDDLNHLDHLNGLDDLDIRLFYFLWQGGDPVRAHQQGRLHRRQRLQGNGRGLRGEKTTGEDKTCRN